MCPKCKSKNASFIALVDDRFFRPTMGDLRAWKADRATEKSGGPQTGAGESRERDENISSNAPAAV